MRRKITLFIVIWACFILQSTIFQKLTFADISPNLMVILVSSFGFMRGNREGMWVGFFCGVVLDIFCGYYMGVYALLYLYVGFVNGFFQKRFYPDDIKLPMLLIAGSDLSVNLLVYFILFLFRRRFAFGYYLKSVILPELVYTMVITIFLYFILMKINQWLETYEKKGAKKFDAVD